jgi:hypothetical protein
MHAYDTFPTTSTLLIELLSQAAYITGTITLSFRQGCQTVTAKYLHLNKKKSHIKQFASEEANDNHFSLHFAYST